MKNQSAVQMAAAVLLLLGFVFVGVLVLHLGLRLAWGVLAIPVTIFATLQAAFLPAMSLAHKDKTLRAGVAVLALYCLGSCLLVFYSGLRWGLIAREDRAFWIFSIVFGCAAAAGWILMPQRWRESISGFSGADCARCGHSHEFRDCKRGCRADQFKYRLAGL
jgi:hypothetical protein